jgi:sodium-dependent dicarboxylate transporter 2/3/5
MFRARMLATAWSRLDARRRVGLLLGAAAFAAFGSGWLGAGLDPAARWTAGTVVLMAIWWIAEPVPLWATALLPALVFPLAGAAPLGEVLAQYLDPVNFLFLGGMWIAASLEQWGLHRRIGLGIVARVGVSPRRIVLGFMIATAFLSLWISNTAAAVMMLPIGMAVLHRFAERTGAGDPGLRRFGSALMLGIGYAASMGGIGSKIGTATNMVFVKESVRALGRDVSFLAWLQIGLPVVLVAIPLAWLYLVRVAARLPARELQGARESIEAARRAQGPMRAGERVALGAFLLAASLWVFRQDMDFGAFRIPGWAGFVPWTWEGVLGRPLASLPGVVADLLGPRGAESLIALAIGGGLLLVPVGRRPLRMALPLRRAGRISWGLLVLLGGGFAMAHGISRSGLSQLLAGSLAGLPPLTPFLTLWAVCLATVALSEVASNTATASILLPLLAIAAPDLGLHPATVMLAATLSASFGFMLPAGTPPNAVVFSSGYIGVVQMARSGLAVDLGGSLLIAAVSHHLGPRALGLPG